MTVWKEYKVSVPSQYADLTSSLLIELGSSGTAIRDRYTYDQQPNFQMDEVWELSADDFPAIGAEVSGFYEMGSDHILAQIQNGLSRYQIPYENIQSKEINEEEWAYEWEKYYHAIPVGDEFLIVPIWEKDDHEDEEKQLLYMDPGLAFGTGSHETTQLSIQALERVIKGGETVFDVGTGSGILSLVAASLGASEFFAYDYDVQAVRSARHNIGLNHLDATFHIEKNDLLADVSGQADVIVANILAPLIKRLTSQVSPLLKNNGFYIVSGILKKQQAEIEEQLVQEGLQVVETQEMNEWVVILAQKLNE